MIKELKHTKPCPNCTHDVEFIVEIEVSEGDESDTDGSGVQG